MVRVFILFFLLVQLSVASVYETNCVACHNKLPVSIDKYFYRYLLKFSGERAVKKAMVSYLKQPSKKTTIMPEAFISRFGVKKTTQLTQEQLNEAIDIYWQTYKVFGKLK